MSTPRTDGPHPASFRDPSGLVYVHEGAPYRRVNHVYAEHWDALVGSGLLEELQRDSLLVAHREVDVDHAAAQGAYKVLQPDVVPFVSYPYEWCFGQLRDAALLTLDVQRRAVAHDMVLKDASAYNVQFVGCRPVLIDTLSFETYREGEAWVAYRQFCQHFLAPLAVMAHRDVRLGRMLRSHVEGLPLDLAARLLPATTWLRPGLALHLRLHARAQRAAAGAGDARRDGRRMGRNAMLGLIDSLEGAVRSLEWRPSHSAWADYAQTASHYSPAAAAAKGEAIARFLREARPTTVWDLGANTGAYSRVAAGEGRYTVAMDADPDAVQIGYTEGRARDDRHLLPLLMDLANPSPNLGWGGEERAGLAARGPADVVMALALVHHLAISNNVPWERMAVFFAGLCRWLIVEFVPKGDPKVQALLAHRRDVFDAYAVAPFEEAFARCFTVCGQERLPESGRTLYLMRACGGGG